MRGASTLLTYLSAFLTISVHWFLAGDSQGWKVRTLTIYCQFVLQKVEPLFAIQEHKSTHLDLQKRFRTESDYSTVVCRLDIQWLSAGPVSTWSRSSLSGPPAGTEGLLPTGRGLIPQLALGCLARRELPPDICRGTGAFALQATPSPLHPQVSHCRPRLLYALVNFGGFFKKKKTNVWIHN